MKPNPTLEDPAAAAVARPAFRRLLKDKRAFILPATLFFLVYYFALPVLTGYWSEWMGRKVFGHFSLAYVFALSQFPMAWIIAGLYLRAAARFDRQAAAFLSEIKATESEGSQP